MTRYFFISILLLALFAASSNNAYAKTTKHARTTVNTSSSNNEREQKALPVQAAAPKTSTRATAPEDAENKAHGPKLDEVPHIHHFHKERVKKSKRHHKKIWTMSKVLLLLCHIALLMMAYMHAAH